MEIKTKELGDQYMVEISGEVDLNSAGDVSQALTALTAKKVPTIIVELSGVSYMDSSGIATLVECLQNVNAYAGKLILKNMSEAVRSIFDLANLLPVFTVE